LEKNPLQIAFDMGVRAFNRGIFDSPYKEGTVLLKEWHRGFNTAYFNNLDKLTAADKAA
jgi:hypothetical protein